MRSLSGQTKASFAVRSSQEEAEAERLIALLRQQGKPVRTIHLWGHYIAELPPVDSLQVTVVLQHPLASPRKEDLLRRRRP